MTKAINDFAAAGGVIFAEAAALAYLCRNATLTSGETYEMLGILPGTARCLTDEPVSDPLYCEVTATQQTVISGPEDRLRGFREKRWAIRLEEPVMNCFEVRDQMMLREGHGDLPISEGLSPRPNILATALSLHWGSCPAAAKTFVDAATVSPYAVPG